MLLTNDVDTLLDLLIKKIWNYRFLCYNYISK
jgi:hypothetical protein